MVEPSPEQAYYNQRVATLLEEQQRIANELANLIVANDLQSTEDAGTKLVSQKPPTFSGKGRSDIWLEKLVQCFEAARLPESAYLINTLPLLELVSPADRWWRSMSRRYSGVTWAQFVDMINNHFIRDTREPEQVARDRVQ